MRFVSILGDSISTYKGFNPQDCKVYYDKPTQQRNGFKAALTRTSSSAGESATVLPFAIFSGFTEGRSAA